MYVGIVGGLAALLYAVAVHLPRGSVLEVQSDYAMKAFSCRCGQPIFFHNLFCVACGCDIGYDPVARTLGTIEQPKPGLWTRVGDAREPAPRFRTCLHRTAAAACNWLVPADEPEAVCLACRLTRTIPRLDRPKNAERLRDIEAAKRRMLFGLQNLDLPIEPKADPESPSGIAFDLLESFPGKPVLTGHANGLITINVAEADDDYREKNREALREPYRTVLGHLRHEVGHYYWDVLMRDSDWLEPCRALFGDERASYAEALERHYNHGAPADWANSFISSYATMHPWEDWAETWAHFLHIRSTLETVTAFGVDISASRFRATPFTREALYLLAGGAPDDEFLKWINAWVVLTATFNEVARSMGQPDVYPFVLNGPAVTKLHFVHTVVNARRSAQTLRAPETLAVSADA